MSDPVTPSNAGANSEATSGSNPGANSETKSEALDPRGVAARRKAALAAFKFDHSGSLKDRLLTALIVLVVAFILSVGAKFLPHGTLLVVGFAAAISGLAVFEVVRLFARDRLTLAYRPFDGAIVFWILAAPTIACVVVAVDRVLVGTWLPLVVQPVTAASAIGLCVYLAWAGRKDFEASTYLAARYPPAFLLVSLCAPQLVVLASLPYSIALLWWMVACTALNDAAAYFVGRAIGKHKMAPALSPNKTIEGSIAGVIVGTAAGWGFWLLLMGEDISTFSLILMSFAVTIAAQAADLSKSYLKRVRGVKDTGSFFPGHGGILDRFDAIIGAAPVVLAALLLLDMT